MLNSVRKCFYFETEPNEPEVLQSFQKPCFANKQQVFVWPDVLVLLSVHLTVRFSFFLRETDGRSNAWGVMFR